MFSQEAVDAVGVFSEGLTNLKSCTSSANLEKEMKGRYPSQLHVLSVRNNFFSSVEILLVDALSLPSCLPELFHCQSCFCTCTSHFLHTRTIIG